MEARAGQGRHTRRAAGAEGRHAAGRMGAGGINTWHCCATAVPLWRDKHGETESDELHAGRRAGEERKLDWWRHHFRPRKRRLPRGRAWKAPRHCARTAASRAPASRAFSPRFIQASANAGVEIVASSGSVSVPHLVRNSAGLMWSSAAWAHNGRSRSHLMGGSLCKLVYR